MTWARGDKYYLKSSCGRFTICRINIADQRIYELHDVKSKECLASAKALDDVEAQRAVKHLKDVAEAA